VLLSGCSHHRSGGHSSMRNCNRMLFVLSLSSWLIPGENCIKTKTQQTTFALVRDSLVTYPGVDRSRFHFQQFSDLFQSQINRQLFGFLAAHTSALLSPCSRKTEFDFLGSIVSAGRSLFNSSLMFGSKPWSFSNDSRFSTS